MKELNLNFKEIEQIPYVDLVKIYKGLNRLNAIEKLEIMDVHSYPWMDKRSQKKTHKRWYEKAYPLEDRPSVKTSDLILV